MATMLSSTFKSVKPHSKSVPALIVPVPNPTKSPKPTSRISPLPSPSKKPSPSLSESTARNSWAVYLILSTNPPIKTYVGVTNNFPNRLKQHNGELKGGAKSSRAGRPWICACLIQGFVNKSTAYAFESKWKSISRKLPRKGSSKNEEEAEKSQPLLLQHRCAALNKVKDLIDCSCLEINWSLDPS